MEAQASFPRSMSATRHSEGHVLLPAVVTGTLALALAAGFSVLGIMGRADAAISTVLLSGLGAAAGTLPPAVIWAASAIGAYGLPLAILGVPGHWRRLLLWATSLMVMAGWGPVLVLLAVRPEISMPLLATFWAGLCAFIYASRHHMAADGPA